MKTNYVLIDYESVQPADAALLLNHDHFKVIIFVGELQTRIGFETAAALQTLGTRAQYVKIKGSGPNALDFHIAYYIGCISAKEPDAFFHVISKDTGFDPLIQHLKDMNETARPGGPVRFRRCAEIAGIPLPVKRVAPKTTGREDRLMVVYLHLKLPGNGLPRTLKALQNKIHTVFRQSLTPTETTVLTEEMGKRGWLKEESGKLCFSLPERYP